MEIVEISLFFCFFWLLAKHDIYIGETRQPNNIQICQFGLPPWEIFGFAFVFNNDIFDAIIEKLNIFFNKVHFIISK